MKISAGSQTHNSNNKRSYASSTIIHDSGATEHKRCFAVRIDAQFSNSRTWHRRHHGRPTSQTGIQRHASTIAIRAQHNSKRLQRLHHDAQVQQPQYLRSFSTFTAQLSSCFTALLGN